MKKLPNQIMNAKMLEHLAASKPARDRFGPDTSRNYLAFELKDAKPEISQWLKDLPCPIIGVGTGALRSACDVVLTEPKKISAMIKNINHAPLAAMILVQHLRASETLSLTDSLSAESFAYATVQNGPEFQRWLTEYKNRSLPHSKPDINQPLIDIHIDNNTLILKLNNPKTRNAMNTQMRDALCEALDFAVTNTEFSKVILTGNGATFSIGGALEEFGQTPDPATAHWIRSLRLPAWYLARLQGKLQLHVNGAAIGAGAEMAAFGSYVTASPKAWFQLPELKYGLIPGAGGTASIAHRIGRQKTAYMALSMEKVKAKTALEWGLIDAIID